MKNSNRKNQSLTKIGSNAKSATYRHNLLPPKVQRFRGDSFEIEEKFVNEDEIDEMILGAAKR